MAEDTSEPTEPPPHGSPAGRRSRRSRVVLGVTGAAVVLGVGGYSLTDTQSSRPTSPGAVADPSSAFLAPHPGTTGAGAASASGLARRSASAQLTPMADESQLPKSARERVEAARSFAAAHGVKLLHPVDPKQVPEKTSAAAENAKVRIVGSAQKGTTMRIVTAHGDLTGLRELAWVAGDVTKSGPVSCSQRFKFANEQKPATRKNLLVCWHTSAERSVAVITADVQGRPSRSNTVAVVEREWRKLG